MIMLSFISALMRIFSKPWPFDPDELIEAMPEVPSFYRFQSGGQFGEFQHLDIANDRGYRQNGHGCQFGEFQHSDHGDSQVQ